MRPPVVEGIAPRRAGGRSGGERRKAQAARSSSPAAASASPAPPPRRALSDRELYQTWLRLTLVPDTPAIVEWPYIYLAARALGLTRLGGADYRPEQWRKAVQRLVRVEQTFGSLSRPLGLGPSLPLHASPRPHPRVEAGDHLAVPRQVGGARASIGLTLDAPATIADDRGPHPDRRRHRGRAGHGAAFASETPRGSTGALRAPATILPRCT